MSKSQSTNNKPYKYVKPTSIRLSDWNVDATKYKAPASTPKMTRIGLINGSTNRALTVELPVMVSYGIKDFIEEGKDGNPDKGNDKFSLSLQLPDLNSPELTEAKKLEFSMLINKLKELETKILNDCVLNQSQWFKEEGLSLDVMKSKMFPILKYPKIKDANGKPTKKPDYSRSPTISISVPKWEGEWKVELYNNSRPAPTLIFPNEECGLEPPELVPMFSKVKASITCGGIWVGDKTCGITFKLVEAIVIPSSITSAPGKCGLVADDDAEEDATHTDDDGEKQSSVSSVVVTNEPDEVATNEPDDSDDSEDDASTSSSRIGKGDECADEPIQIKMVPPVVVNTKVVPAPVTRIIKKVTAIPPTTTPDNVEVSTQPQPVKTVIKRTAVKK